MLGTGSRLLAARGVRVTVVGGYAPGNRDGWMWDLTVSNDHDSYVLASGTPVLAHNCAMPKSPLVEPLILLWLLRR